MGTYVSVLQRALAIPLALLYGTLGIAVIMTPLVMLLYSSKSPLRVQNSSYIDGFAMGVAFMFFLIVGVGFVCGAVFILRRRRIADQPVR